MFIVNIIGARPQFIKYASINFQLINNFKNIKSKLIHTGQHYDINMNNIFFNQLELKKPNYNLKIGGGSHGENTGRMIEKIEKILKKIKPDCVIVYGDTDTTLAGAIATSKLNIMLAHIESGLRSYNYEMPEEINRRVTDHCADLLFATSQLSVQNLINEGISRKKIINSGDVMYDIFKLSNKKKLISKKYISKYNLIEKNYIYLTIHRKSNIDSIHNLSKIMETLSKLKNKIIFPIHPNTKKILYKNKIKIPKNIIKIDPVGYFENLSLQKFSSMIITDSGGIQKEAYFSKVKCITLREDTEWSELVSLGVNKLVGVNKGKILEAIKSNNNIEFPKEEIYGNGNAAKKILKKLIS